MYASQCGKLQELLMFLQKPLGAMIKHALMRIAIGKAHQELPLLHRTSISKSPASEINTP